MTTAVILEMQAKPECIEEMKAFLKEILPDTRAYDGCQGLDPYENLDTGGNIILYELWDSKENYEKYLAWRKDTGVLDKVGTMVSEPPSIRFFEKIDA